MTTRGRLITPTRLARHAARASVVTILATAAYLVVCYPSLPALLPVHFRSGGVANGWQYKTLSRVLLPVFIQVSLAVTFGAIASLLLSRSRRGTDSAGSGTTAASADRLVPDETLDGGPAGEGPPPDHAPDIRAALAAAETVLLMAVIWIAFQAYAAYALVRMWSTGVGHLGVLYTVLEWGGLLLTGVVAVRGRARVGRPVPRPYVATHWRLGQLYKNPDDPALFVPARDGVRWTLNFGRPVAAALLGVVLTVGVIGPTIILILALRYNF